MNNRMEKEKKIIDYGRNFNLYMFLYEKDRIISPKPCESYTSRNKDITFDIISFDDLDIEQLKCR